MWVFFGRRKLFFSLVGLVCFFSVFLGVFLDHEFLLRLVYKSMLLKVLAKDLNTAKVLTFFKSD